MTIEIISKRSNGLKLEGNAGSPSKAILSAEFSELKRDSGAFIHNVLLSLRPPSELTVLKKPSESSTEFSHRVRSHDLSRVSVSLYSVVSNAMQVEVPGTVLGYVYQLSNGKPIQEWLVKLAQYKTLPPTVSPSRQNGRQLALVPLHKTYTAPSSPVSRRLKLCTATAAVATAESARPTKLSSGSMSTSSEQLSQDDEEESGEEDMERDILREVCAEDFQILSVESSASKQQEPIITIIQASAAGSSKSQVDTPKGYPPVSISAPQGLSSEQNGVGTVLLERAASDRASSETRSQIIEQLRCNCRSASDNRLDRMGGAVRKEEEEEEEEGEGSLLNRTASDRTPTEQKSRIVDQLMCTCHSVLVDDQARSGKDGDRVKVNASSSARGRVFDRLNDRRSTTPNLASTLVNPEGENFLRSRFHHTQIRKGKLKYSPRIKDGSVSSQNSASPPPASVVSSTSSTVLSSLADHERLQPVGHSSRSVGTVSTLPRTKKQNAAKESGDPPTSTSSPVTTPQKAGYTKSPKLLRIFHRRWQSSSAIKVPPSLDAGDSPAPTNTPEPKKPRRLCEMPARQVAEELLLWDAEMLRKIAPLELEGGAWMKKNKHESSPAVMEMVRTFNELVFLVGTEIVSEETPQARAKVISQFIRVAGKCYSLRNYNGLKAILAALQSSPVHRLSRTWREVPSRRIKRFEKLAEFLSTDNNSHIYHCAIQQHLNDATPFVPFLGQFLTDANAMEITRKMKMAAQKKVEEAKMDAGTGGSNKLLMKRRSSSLSTSSLHQLIRGEGEGKEERRSNGNKPVTSSPAAAAAVSRLSRVASTVSVSAPTSPLGSDCEQEDEKKGEKEGEKEGEVDTTPHQIREKIESSSAEKIEDGRSKKVEEEEEEEEESVLQTSLSSIVLELDLNASDADIERRCNGTKARPVWLFSPVSTPDDSEGMRKIPSITCLDTCGGGGGEDGNADFGFPKVPSFPRFDNYATTINGEDKIDGPSVDISGSLELDSGIPSSVSRTESRSISIPKSPSLASLDVPKDEATSARFGSSPLSELSLEQIDFDFHRKSRSFESLYNDEHYHNVLQRSLAELSRLSASLQSFDSDVFDEEESSLYLHQDFELSDCCLSDTSSLNQSYSLDASGASSQFANGMCSVTSTPIKTFTPKLTRGDSDPTILSCKLEPQTPEGGRPPLSEEEQQQRPKKTVRSKSNPATTNVAVVTSKDAATGGGTPSNHRRKRRISRSWRRNKKTSNGSSQKEATGGGLKKTEPETVREYLHSLQVASLGCSVGLESRDDLRKMLVELPRVSDSENYHLSVEREPKETQFDL